MAIFALVTRIQFANWLIIASDCAKNSLRFLSASIVCYLACSVMLAHAAPAPIKGLHNPHRIPGQYIVVLKSNLVSAQDVSANVQSIATHNGFQINQQFHSVFNGFTIKADQTNSVTTQSTDDALLNALANNPDVAFIEADQLVHADDIVVNQSAVDNTFLNSVSPNSLLSMVFPEGVEAPINADLWGLDRINQRTLPLDHTYTFNKTGANVHAYILDSGLNATHQEFTGRVSNGADFVLDGKGTADCVGHGTHIAGTIGGTHFGVAKQVTFHPVRVLDCTNNGPWSQIISGIEWVITNHKSPALINMSIWGGKTDAVNLAVEQAVAAGITVVVIAGNDSGDACLNSPASTPSAITVAASDIADKRSTFSSVGSCVDLFAPGTNIKSASIPNNTSTALMSGTSMAAPHVSGVVARYLEKNPTATPQEVATALTNNATKSTLTDTGANSPNLLVNSDVDIETNWKRTVVFIYGETVKGQDMFIRGGFDHTQATKMMGLNCTSANKLCAMPIRHLNFLNNTTTPWKKGDNFLDWYGAEATQPTTAQGTPLDWTTNAWPAAWGTKKTVAINGYGETPLNLWGHHYWMLDVEMDCARTFNGWFEVKSFISNGPGWESNITQPQAPWASNNHFAQCGKLNVFKRGQNNPVTIGKL